ncbi:MULTISPECIES: cytosine permease [unclassified Lactococcus]|uniref:purine-cytosine permease family protein n=1 Tax=unclassified Lactococcus TaxID=2643510 RepID=UPI0011C7EE49|nr:MULTISPECIES: cytosine permease [unclassified Lactococcus]MQW23512.1 allantoin permease [Lactococcus sp. dk101]TXK37842.1 allantoin permease [Lactococcus sp. dk310]TXK49300.1 allantoin permease [Lactococcus sp. dk322]
MKNKNAETQGSALNIEQNGINVIDESERKGSPKSLFWPWFAANIAVLSVSYGAWTLEMGINAQQAIIATTLGIIVAFLLVGFVSLAGKRGSAPTMILSRSAFGVNGNRVPAVISWLICVGWETILVVLSTLAVATVFKEMHWASGNMTKIIAFLVVIAIIVGVAVLGFDAIMNFQKWLTIILGIATIVYFILCAHLINFNLLTTMKPGNFAGMIGAAILVITGLGMSWINSAADYSRYIPRKASSKGVVGWTTFGGALTPVILVIFGILLVASQKGNVTSAFATNISADPIGTLASVLPTWYLLPFTLVSVISLVSGAVLDIYSSGLALLAIGLPVKRWVGTCLDGIIMFLGTIYILWFASSDFFSLFEAFLFAVGVPIAGWSGIFLAELVIRKKDYDEKALFDAKGRYGSVNWVSLLGMIVASIVGFGFMTSTVSGFTWQGYLFNSFLPKAVWGYSNLGVFIALLIGFIVPFFNIKAIRKQEA